MERHFFKYMILSLSFVLLFKCDNNPYSPHHNLNISIEKADSIDTLYTNVGKTYWIIISDDQNNDIRTTDEQCKDISIELLTPFNGCEIWSDAHYKITWLPEMCDTGLVTLKIKISDKSGDCDTVIADFFIESDKNFAPISVGNTWKYNFFYQSECYGYQGTGSRIECTSDVTILSRKIHSDSIQFSFEERRSGISTRPGSQGADDIISNYFFIDTVNAMFIKDECYLQSDMTSWAKSSPQKCPFFFNKDPQNQLDYEQYDSNSQLKYSYYGGLSTEFRYFNNIGLVKATYYTSGSFCGSDKFLYDLISYSIKSDHLTYLDF